MQIMTPMPRTMQIYTQLLVSPLVSTVVLAPERAPARMPVVTTVNAPVCPHRS